jgi:hypothetical protein
MIFQIDDEITQPTAKFQVEFIAFIKRLLSEGEFSATYKFSFLHAIADLCLEKQNASDRTLSFDALANKFSELYWNHSLPYSSTDKAPSL